MNGLIEPVTDRRKLLRRSGSIELDVWRNPAGVDAPVVQMELLGQAGAGGASRSQPPFAKIQTVVSSYTILPLCRRRKDRRVERSSAHWCSVGEAGHSFSIAIIQIGSRAPTAIRRAVATI